MKNSICDKTQEALAAYLDGDNAALQSAEVQTHLAACEDCQAVYAEVQHALTAGNADDQSLAFPQNGAARPAPDAQYWNELPDRVMARIEGRTSLEATDNVPTPVVSAQKRLRDTWFIKTFAASKTRSLLALTAVVFLVVVVTREMQDSLPESQLQAPHDTQITAAESGPVSAEEERNAQPSVPVDERSREKKISAVTSKPLMAESKLVPQPNEAPTSTTERAASQAEQITPPAPQMVSSGENRSQADDQPQKLEDELSLAQSEVEKNKVPASVDAILPRFAKEAAEDRKPSKAGEASGLSMKATSQPAKMRAMSVSSQAASSASESSYSQALWRAQQAVTPKAQQIIWQDFLSFANDSTYIKLAIAQLAQGILAQVDSNSTAEQVKSTLQFLEQHETVLRLELGAEKLSGEMRRVKLLQGKK